MNTDYHMKSFHCDACQSDYLQDLNQPMRCSRCSSQSVHDKTPNPQSQSFPSTSGREENPSQSTNQPLYDLHIHRVFNLMPDGSVIVTQTNLYIPVSLRNTNPQDFANFSSFMNFVSLLDILNQAQQNQQGSPPASEEAINSLPLINCTIAKSVCPICQDNYREEDKIRQMPCKHDFHDSCLSTWLRMHNTCPICRFQLSSPNGPQVPVS
ncbi:unnamed protein product [Blepharisma stoltei]|uniref:RING-type E3 ubiquitin transferase n=1 Tax=Blepharisma stoltei TaxID=1481888 RepID=A0AAU9IEG2_9CILI|nr:unnamed protein product [Blepharisma stoltei]